MGPHLPHRLGLARDPFAPLGVQPFGLDEGEGDVAVEEGVVGEVDALLAAFPEEPFDGVAAGRE